MLSLTPQAVMDQDNDSGGRWMFRGFQTMTERGKPQATMLETACSVEPGENAAGMIRVAAQMGYTITTETEVRRRVKTLATGEQQREYTAAGSALATRAGAGPAAVVRLNFRGPTCDSVWEAIEKGELHVYGAQAKAVSDSTSRTAAKQTAERILDDCRDLLSVEGGLISIPFYPHAHQLKRQNYYFPVSALAGWAGPEVPVKMEETIGGERGWWGLVGTGIRRSEGGRLLWKLHEWTAIGSDVPGMVECAALAVDFAHKIRLPVGEIRKVMEA